MTPALVIIGATDSLPSRIAAKVERLPNGCHQWKASGRRRRDGVVRPAVRVGGRESRKATVARVVLALKDGVPLHVRDLAKLEAGHTCGNYWCVNPEHLTWQTRVENEREKVNRDRYEDFAAAVDALAAQEATC